MTFMEKAHKNLVFGDLFMIALNAVGMFAILLRLVGVLSVEYNGLVYGWYAVFMFINIPWYLGLRARWIYTPDELREVTLFHTNGGTTFGASKANDPGSRWFN